MRSIIQRPSLLSFSGLNAGLDPTLGATFAVTAAASGANFQSLTQGSKKGTVGGTSITASTDSVLGPVVTLPPNATSSGAGFTFTGNSSATFPVSTICALARFTSFTTNQYLFSNGSGSMFVSGAAELGWVVVNVVAEGSGITLAAGVPYFLAASQLTNGLIIYLAKRLDTGKIVTGTSGAGTPGGGSTSWVVGNSTNAVDTANAAMSAVLFTPYASSAAKLLQLSNDPFSLWYPNTTLQMISNSLAQITVGDVLMAQIWI